MTKSGKLRSLIRELTTKYPEDDGAKKFPCTTYDDSTCDNSRSYLFSQDSKHTFCIVARPQPKNDFPATPRCVADLKKEVQTLDAHFDSCQDVWAKGECDGFFTDVSLVGE